MKNGDRSKNLEDYMPNAYKVVDGISEFGPEVVVFIRYDLMDEDLKK